MRLAWGAKVSPLFRERLLAMCVRLGIDDPNWMMACIAFETGHTFSSRVQNAQSGATGLIQFMPSTARGMGTTVDELRETPPEDQLARVEQYFRPYAGRLHSLDDVYMAILWPKAVGKLLTYPLFSKDDADARAYFGNKGLDINADGVVTKGEATAYVQKTLNAGLEPGKWVETAAQDDAGATITPAPAPTQPESPKPPQTPDLSQFRPQESAMPLVPMLLTLLPQIVGGFSPAGQAQIKPVLNQPADQLGPLLVNLFSMFAQKTGVVPADQTIATDAQAIATVAEFNRLKETNAALVSEIEQSTLNRIKIIAPMFDRLAEADKAYNEARIAGANAATERALRDPYDVAPVMVGNVTQTSNWLLAGLTVATIVAMALKAWKPDIPDYVSMLLPVLGLLAGQISKERGAIIAYRFDGTPSSNAANAINAEIARTGK